MCPAGADSEFLTAKAQIFRKQATLHGRPLGSAPSRLLQFDLPDVTILVDRLTSSYVVSECSSSRPTRGERGSEELTVFAGGNTRNLDNTALWALKEVGLPLDQRLTEKLMDDLRKSLRTPGKSPPWLDARSPM